MTLNALSDRIGISRQTLVRWVDRHLIVAALGWSLSDSNSEVRTIELADDTLDFLVSFAADYRVDTVSPSEARQILKKVDRKRVKKMIQGGEIEVRDDEGEKRVIVGSIEDFLKAQEDMGHITA